jgi:hypothetical protein
MSWTHHSLLQLQTLNDTLIRGFTDIQLISLILWTFDALLNPLSDHAQFTR